MPLNGLNKVDAKSRFTVSQLVSFVPLLFSVSLKLYFFLFFLYKQTVAHLVV